MITRSEIRGPAGPGGKTGPAGPGGNGSLALVALVAVLCGIGVMMVLSASSVQALRAYGGPWVFFVRQLLWVALGMAALILVARVDYHRWQVCAKAMVVVSLVLLALVLVPRVGLSAGGSSRWLGIGQVRFQPSELAKLALLLFVADLMARNADRAGRQGAILRPVLLMTGGIVLLILRQPDMGTAMIVVLVVMTVLFVGGISLGRMTGLVLLWAAGGAVVGLLESYRRARLFSFVNPWKDPSNTGYQVAQSLVALGTGHVTGVGLGASRAKWGFLPNAHTDFIFAIIGEELGLLGTVAVVGLFAAFAVFGIRTALRAPDRFGMLTASGVTVWVVGQAIINVGAVTGILPVTGVPLPFVSFGGSSLVITMVAVGILVNVATLGGRCPPSAPRTAATASGRPGR